MNFLRKLPPLTALKAFEAVARNLSVTKASAELCVTPAAISQQIKILEQYFERPLFRRLPTGLIPTDEAKLYLEQVSRALDGLCVASEQLRRVHHTGVVRISVLPSLATRWLAPRLAGFARRFKTIELDIVSDMSTVDLSRSNYDLAVRFGSGNYPGLRVDPLMDENLFPVCSPRLLHEGKGITHPSDLYDHCLINELVKPADPSSEDWLTWQPWLQSWNLASEDFHNKICMTDTAAILSAVETGAGIAIGRSRLLMNQIESGRLVTLFDLRRKSNLAYYVVSHPATANLPRVEAVRDWLLNEGAADWNAVAA
jgi:LysR family glycine cleavage system transcriptional activator